MLQAGLENELRRRRENIAELEKRFYYT